LPIGVTPLTTSGTDVDSTSIVTADIAPTPSKLLVAYFSAERSGVEPATPTVSGFGATWVAIDSHYWRTTTIPEKDFLFAADSGSSPAAGPVTFDFGGVTHAGSEWSVYEVDGSDVANGVAQCFVQLVKTTADPASANSMLLTLAAAGDPENRAFLSLSRPVTTLATPEAGWIELGEVAHAGPANMLMMAWRPDVFDTSPSASWGGAAGLYGGMAWEIKAAAEPPSHPRKALLGVGV
jgi:hypothetical protein